MTPCLFGVLNRYQFVIYSLGPKLKYLNQGPCSKFVVNQK